MKTSNKYRFSNNHSHNVLSVFSHSIWAYMYVLDAVYLVHMRPNNALHCNVTVIFELVVPDTSHGPHQCVDMTAHCAVIRNVVRVRTDEALGGPDLIPATVVRLGQDALVPGRARVIARIVQLAARYLVGSYGRGDLLDLASMNNFGAIPYHLIIFCNLQMTLIALDCNFAMFVGIIVLPTIKAEIPFFAFLPLSPYSEGES
mmetsp:Transcript_35171/g.64699  ORF Transcript_35171/g.64699 Transcript_35171/m.64699 type:complete len:202 (-) Transcript_35171:127-732(-)